MIVYPNAKINLGLHVLRRRSDGYHDLATVFYPIPLQDALEVHEAERFRFRQAGTILDCPAGDNLVIRSLGLLESEFSIPNLDIFLYKHIPSGAGLGGGSADAAFMMRLLNEEFHLGLSADDLRQRLASIGADCPFFVDNQPALATGIGDHLIPLDYSLEGWNLLLVKPDIEVSTRDAYAGVRPLEREGEDGAALLAALQQPVEEWQGVLVNDFEPGIFSRHPEIAAIRDLMLDLGATYAAMSGSGSAVFGLFRQSLEAPEEKFAGCFVRQRRLEKPELASFVTPHPLTS
ncbi:MAG: 4-(cytidine 5'-diphospho)-2-C-methyl-D-erythritol kinase [Bacteroidales bacterium]|nr:4-(cytidine 5'-diphospho)-2-C-methyl-D-erythritol kinase [Bacteroidales bacterium]